MFVWGMSISILYFFVLGVIIHKLNLETMSSWNEFGDFLAGAFSPVAFLWLVLGYLQQQKELQQNTKALELQAEELRNSVEQYKEMVSVAKEQLISDTINLENAKREKEIQYKPNIKPPHIAPSVTYGGVNFKYRGQVVVAKEDALNLSIKTQPEFKPFHNFKMDFLGVGVINLGESLDIKADELPKTIVLTMTYESRLGVSYSDEYTYLLGSDGIYTIVDDISR